MKKPFTTPTNTIEVRGLRPPAPTFKEKRFILNSKTLSGDMYRLQLAFNKLKRAISRVPLVKSINDYLR